MVKQANVIELIDGSERQPRLPAAPAALACAELLVSGFNSLNHQHIALSSLIHQCNAMRQQRERESCQSIGFITKKNTLKAYHCFSQNIINIFFNNLIQQISHCCGQQIASGSKAAASPV